MSDRRVPRTEDDYSAELPRPVGAAPLGPSGHSPRKRGEIRSALTYAGLLPIAGEAVSSRGDPALPAAPSVRPQPDGAAICSDAAALVPPARREEAGAPSVAPSRDAPAFALSVLSEPVQMLVMMIGAYHRESDTAAIERAVARYAEKLGIRLLARPMEMDPPPHAGGPKDGRDTRLAPEGDHAQHGGGGLRVPAASGSDPAFSPDDRATGTIDGSVSKPPSSGFAVPRQRGEIRSADAQAPP